MKLCRKNLIRSFTAGVTASLILAIGANANADSGSNSTNNINNTVAINFLGITDFHGHFSKVTNKSGKVIDPGAVSLACQMDLVSKKYQSNFRLSAGDNFGASPFNSAIQNDEPTISVLNELKLQYSAVGNHEFDQGAKVLAKRIKGEDGHVAPVFKLLGANLNAPEIAPYSVTVDQASGLKIGFVGGVTADLPTLVTPKGIKGITVTDPVKAINTTAKKLKQESKADIVVAMIHEGGKKTATQYDASAVDAVFAGHTHMPFETKNPIPIVQADHYAKALGQIVLNVDKKTKKVTTSSTKLYHSGEIASCKGSYPKLQKIVSDAEAKGNKLGAKPLVKVGSPFYRGVVMSKPGGELHRSRGVESTLGDMIANAVRSEYTKTMGKQADIGVINAGGLRDDLIPDNEGWLSKAKLFSTQPFGNSIFYVDLTGKQVIELLEEQWQNKGISQDFLKLGLSDNVSYLFDASRSQGKKILSVTIDGKPIDINKTYRVAGNSFLLQGGDNFSVFKRARPKDTGLLDIDLTIKYLQSAKIKKSVTQLRDGAIGIDNSTSLPDKLLAGSSYNLKLSSLSFTDPNMRAESVSVCLADQSGKKVLATAKVNNSFILNSVATGTNDRFGQTSLSFKVPNNAKDGADLQICNIKAPFVTTPVSFAKIKNNHLLPSPSVVPSVPAVPSETAVENSVTSGSVSLAKLPKTGSDPSLDFGYMGLILLSVATAIFRKTKTH